MRVPKRHYTELVQLFVSIGNADDVAQLLEDILTPQEIESLAERWQIVKELAAGNSQREVAAKLNVSISKVTRGSRVLKYGTGAFARFIQKLGHGDKKMG